MYQKTSKKKGKRRCNKVNKRSMLVKYAECSLLFFFPGLSYQYPSPSFIHVFATLVEFGTFFHLPLAHIDYIYIYSILYSGITQLVCYMAHSPFRAHPLKDEI